MVLDIELVVESGSPPVQRTNEVFAGTGSKGQCQDVGGREIGGKVSETLGRLVCSKAEADRAVGITGVYDEVVGQIVGEVGEGGLDNGRNGFRNTLCVMSVMGTALRSKVTRLDILEREDNRLQFEMNACFEPVLSGDGDPLAIG